MVIHVDSILKKYLQPGEAVLWSGQPLPEAPVRTMKTIMILLNFLGLLFIFLGLLQVAIAGYEASSAMVDSGAAMSTYLKYSFRQNLPLFITGIMFILFRLFAPFFFREESNTIYAITSRRLLIIEHVPGKISKSTKKSFGPGEVDIPSVRKKGKNLGDVFFAEATDDLGTDVTGKKRIQLVWVGFMDVKDPDKVSREIVNWLKMHLGSHEVVNKVLGFSLIIPKEWSARGLTVKHENRDNFLLSVIAGDYIHHDRLLSDVHLPEEWNTLILVRKVGSSHGGVHYLTILVEGAVSKLTPVVGKERLLIRENRADLTELADAPDTLSKTARDSLLICQFTNLIAGDPRKKGIGYVLLNEGAKPIDLNEMRSFEWTGTINIMEQGFKFRQIYSYKNKLHLRFTFFCPEPLFKDNHKQLNEVVKSVKYLVSDHPGRYRGRPGGEQDAVLPQP